MISIHQSQFLPWVPYFYKYLNSDTFVILDDVQFQKNGVQNRNTIKTPTGAQWLTLPIKHKLGTPINEVEIVNASKSIEKIIKTIDINYKKCEYYDSMKIIWDGLIGKNIFSLFSLNDYLFNSLIKIISKQNNVVLSSTLNTTVHKEDLIIEIIKKTGDNDYLTGKGALNYINIEKFKKNNINVFTYDFTYREYPQLWMQKIGFVPELSIIDLLYNHLNEATNYIIKNGNISRLI